MAVATLRQEISEIEAKADRPDAPENHLGKLFELFRRIDDVLADCAADEEGDAKAAGLIEAQSVVIRTAAAVPARSLHDLLYKLALWRWDAPDLDKPTEDMSRSDAIVYSAFRDLVKTLDEQSVLKDFDKTK